MKKNREAYKEVFKEEISWIKDNLQDLTQNKHKFLIEMYTILVTGSRKVTPKMASAIKSSIIKCKGDPRYNETVRKMEEVRLEPILEKISMVESLAKAKGDRALEFVQSVKQYVKTNFRITKKQMDGLNKVYKRVSEDLFKKGENND